MTRRRSEWKQVRELVECAIARTGGEISNLFLMDAYDLTYRQLHAIKAGMADEEPQRTVAEDNRARTFRPCGTHAAYMRHYKTGERPCDDCREAEKAYQRARKRNWRAAA